MTYCKKASQGPITVCGLEWTPTGANYVPGRVSDVPPWKHAPVTGGKLPPGAYYRGKWRLFYCDGGWTMRPNDYSGAVFFGGTPEECQAAVTEFCDSAPKGADQ